MSSNKLTRATQEPAWVRYILLGVGLGFLFFFLGLPLVARVASQHGGTASAHNAHPHGFIVRLGLPEALSLAREDQDKSGKLIA